MDYMQRVKIRLIEKNKNQKWLYEEVKKKTGLFCDNSYLSKISRGQHSSPKIRKAINEILDIKEDT